MEIMKVSSSSSPTSVAGALSSMIRSKEEISIQVIGAAALNQAIKAIAIARGYVVSTGIEIACVPAFHDLVIEDKIVTAIRLKIVIL
ncbi:stage V sporulation protein S [Tannockella kyphosi]|uniref:stage V sporulation protein S n=1 Tax=Tannockella kyphosi TaxID=2899121 RepID=UPI002011C4C2|nr:stage V sporulation protein S [Tannockella kyphosi]